MNCIIFTSGPYKVGSRPANTDISLDLNYIRGEWGKNGTQSEMFDTGVLN